MENMLAGGRCPRIALGQIRIIPKLAGVVAETEAV
jgi:hypothetical protein